MCGVWLVVAIIGVNFLGFGQLLAIATPVYKVGRVAEDFNHRAIVGYFKAETCANNQVAVIYSGSYIYRIGAEIVKSGSIIVANLSLQKFFV